MRKFVTFVLALVLFVVPAFSESQSLLLFKYNACASYYGAPQLQSGENVKVVELDDQLLFYYESFGAGFFFDDSGRITKAVAMTWDDAGAEDFLFTCMAMVSFLGDIDFSAFGMILYQFAAIKAGNETSLCFCGSDAFQIVAEEGGCVFVYMNTDLMNN